MKSHIHEGGVLAVIKQVEMVFNELVIQYDTYPLRFVSITGLVIARCTFG